ARSIAQFAMTGTSQLRQEIARNHLTAIERSKMSALVGLVSRSVDISASLAADGQQSEPVSHERAEALEVRVSTLLQKIQHRGSFEDPKWPPTAEHNSSRFSELEATIRLMESVLDANALVNSDPAPYQESGAADSLFVSDAFSNPEYLKFALA